MFAVKQVVSFVVVEHDSYGKVEGLTFTLGEGDTGQLGLGPDIMERKKPGKVDLPQEIVQICAGGMHTVCLTKDGNVSQKHLYVFVIFHFILSIELISI